MLYTFLLTANRIFDAYDETELIAAIIENVDSLGEVDADEDELTTLLSDLFITRRIIGIKTSDFEGEEKTIEIPIPPEILSEKQIEIISVLRKYK